MRLLLSLTLLTTLVCPYKAHAMEFFTKTTKKPELSPAYVNNRIEHATTLSEIPARDEIMDLYDRGLYRKSLKPDMIKFESWRVMVDITDGKYVSYILHEYDTEEITAMFPRFFETVHAKAEDNDLQHVNNKGYMYFMGKGVELDHQIAAACFKFAALKEDAEGQYNYGVMCEHGYGVKKDYKEAARLYALSANFGKGDKKDVQGYGLAQYALGLLHEADKDIDEGGEAVEAVALYRLAAAQNIAAAQSRLALMHFKGEGGVMQSDSVAVQYAKLAAYQQDSWAQAFLGYMYVRGRGGLVESPTTGFEICKLSAEQDDPRGQSLLARMYQRGWGVTINLLESLRWSLKPKEEFSHEFFINLPISQAIFVDNLYFQKLIAKIIQGKSTLRERGHGPSLSLLFKHQPLKIEENRDVVQKAKEMSGAFQKIEPVFRMTAVEFTDECEGFFPKKKEDFSIWKLSAEQDDPRRQGIFGMMSRKGWVVGEYLTESLDWTMKVRQASLKQEIVIELPISQNTCVAGEGFQQLIAEIIDEKLSLLLERCCLKIRENEDLESLYRPIIEIGQEAMVMMHALQKAGPVFMITGVELTDECNKLLSKQKGTPFFAVHKVENVTYFTLKEENVILVNKYLKFLEWIDEKFQALCPKRNIMPIGSQKRVSEVLLMADLSRTPNLVAGDLLYNIYNSSEQQSDEEKKYRDFINFEDDNEPLGKSAQLGLSCSSESGADDTKEVEDELATLTEIKNQIRALLHQGAPSRNKRALEYYPELGWY